MMVPLATFGDVRRGELHGNLCRLYNVGAPGPCVLFYACQVVETRLSQEFCFRDTNSTVRYFFDETRSTHMSPNSQPLTVHGKQALLFMIVPLLIRCRVLIFFSRFSRDVRQTTASSRPMQVKPGQGTCKSTGKRLSWSMFL